VEELDVCPHCGAVTKFEKGWLSSDYKKAHWTLPLGKAILRRLSTTWLPITLISVALFAFVAIARRDLGKALLAGFILPALALAGEAVAFARDTKRGEYTHYETVNRLLIVRNRCPACGYRFEERSFALVEPIPDGQPLWQRVEGWHGDEIILDSEVRVLDRSDVGDGTATGEV